MNKLLNKYYGMLYFTKGKPTTLEKLSNWELNGILLHIKKYPVGLLNGYDKQEYINAVNYIIKCRANAKDYRTTLIETRLANNAINKAEQLTNVILSAMLNTEKQYKKLVLI